MKLQRINDQDRANGLTTMRGFTSCGVDPVKISVFSFGKTLIDKVINYRRSKTKHISSCTNLVSPIFKVKSC